jgi:hypothetical protein
MRRTLLLLASLLVAGCNSPTQPYIVRVIRPDGIVHKTHTIASHGRPVVLYRAGMTYAYGASQTLTAPVGWMIEVEDASRPELRY